MDLVSFVQCYYMSAVGILELLSMGNSIAYSHVQRPNILFWLGFETQFDCMKKFTAFGVCKHILQIDQN